MDTSSGFGFQLTEEQEAIRTAAREFAENEIRPHVMEWDEKEEFPRELFRKMGDLGFLGMVIPTEYNGAGMGYLEYAIVVEEIARVCPSVALGVAAHNGLCMMHIYRFGSEELRQKYVTSMATGAELGGWGLTEPNAGSDAGGTQTTAVRDGDHYIINGSKNFITHGYAGNFALVMAMTDPGKGKKGISAFAIDKSMAGYSAAKQGNKVGMRASDTSTLTFDNVRVPASHLVGAEGEGFVQALKILDGGRISIAALSVGLAQGAFEAAMKYSRQRVQFGKPIGDQQGIQMKLAKMSMNVDAARMLTYKAAALRDAGKPFGKEASQAKLFASEICVQAAEEAVQVHGGYGYIKEYPVEKLWRDSKLLTIGEGTSEVQKMVIARHLVAELA